MPTPSTQTTSDITLTYKYLLTFSTLSAVFFCWLYVTKPTVITHATAEAQEGPSVQSDLADTASKHETMTTSNSFANLANSKLPGEVSSSAAPAQISAVNKNSNIPLPVSDSTKDLVGFEETNDRVQHVITAQSNNSSERIILEVPVIYKTRALRFGPEQAHEASRVLRALKIYQSQIKKLHQDGKNIQLAWDSLLMSAQPVAALRADSPSLPQKSSSHPSMLPENSASTIKLSN
ncbi:MAG: hypothetical protein ABGY95_04570 [Rubritalea sp.]|uniref:hypothetical protein n=1 Tax=Rubritalea sp. TaxID=2109375 RepID=UPI003242CDCD